MRQPAPIAIFAFKRAAHLDATIASLRECSGFSAANIFVFGDGPRNSQDVADVRRTREVAERALGDRAEFIYRDENWGLARSIIGGVDHVLQQFDRVIVLEDDLELSENFLTYMNAALDRFEHDDAVRQISGHMFEVPGFRSRNSALLLPFTTTWGWGTWRRAWKRFDPTAEGWEELGRNRQMRDSFNLGGVYDYATMLERQMRGRSDSWGIRWYWSVFRDSGLVCFPPRTLVRNKGMDGSGTHGSGRLRLFDAASDRREVGELLLPDVVAVQASDLMEVKEALWRQNGGWTGAALDLGRRIFALMRR